MEKENNKKKDALVRIFSMWWLRRAQSGKQQAYHHRSGKLHCQFCVLLQSFCIYHAKNSPK